MTTIIKTETQEAEEQKTLREEIREMKDQIKEMVKEQTEEKRFLHMPHSLIPKTKMTTYSGYTFECGGYDRAGRLMMSVRNRRDKITNAHIKYNKMRGKPYDMYTGRKGGDNE